MLWIFIRLTHLRQTVPRSQLISLHTGLSASTDNLFISRHTDQLYHMYPGLGLSTYTVNSEIFARVLHSQNFAYGKLRENKILQNGEITLSFTDIGKSCLSREFLTPQISFNAIRENKILAKI